MLALTIKKEDIARGVAQTAAIAEKRTSLPALSHVLLQAEGNELRLTATDMEITFRGSYPAQVETPGSFAVPAKKFNELIRLLGAGEVSLREGENSTLHLKAGNFKTQLNGLPPDEFPQADIPANAQFIEVEGPALAGIIDKTIYAVAADETRYNLAGIYFEKVETEGAPCLRMASTDGHRLNIADFTPSNAASLELPKGVLLSKKGASELKKLADTNDRLLIAVAAGSVLAKTPKALLAMRLLEGRFPDYHVVIPGDSNLTVTVDRKAIMDALKRISAMSSDQFSGVKYTLAPGSLTMSSNSQDVGTAEERLDAEYDGDGLESGFNPRYYIDALGTLASERIQLTFKDAMTPVIITGAEDPGYKGIVMAMRIQGA